MSYNCLTVSCVLRRTILLNQIRAKVSHITLTTRVIRSQRQSAYSTLTYILRRTFKIKAQSYNCRSYYTNNTSYICCIDELLNRVFERTK